MNLYTIVGRYFIHRWRRRVEEAGITKVATQLRKQGVPLPIARILLTGRL